jgi:hypothetical protein
MGNEQCKKEAVELKNDLQSANKALEELKMNSIQLDKFTLTHDISKKQVQSFVFHKSVPYSVIIHEANTARTSEKTIPINVNEIHVPLFEPNGTSLCYNDIDDSFGKCQGTAKHLLFLLTHANKENPSSPNINSYSGKIRVLDSTAKKQDNCLSVSEDKWATTKCDNADIFSIKL